MPIKLKKRSLTYCKFNKKDNVNYIQNAICEVLAKLDGFQHNIHYNKD